MLYVMVYIDNSFISRKKKYISVKTDLLTQKKYDFLKINYL